MHRYVLLLAAFFLSSSTVSGKTLHKEKLMIDGLKRTWLLHQPRSCPAQTLKPLVIVLHGGGGKAKGMVRLTRGTFNTLADRDGSLVAYPAGIDHHWNDGRGVPFIRAQTENIDDVKFIGVLIDSCIVRYGADPARVYVTGISNGAMMAHRLAVDLSSRITAVAVVAGNLPEKRSGLAPQGPVPVLVINGTDDPLVRWHGGEIVIGRQRHGRVISVEKTVDYWVRNNQCLTQPQVQLLPDLDPADGTTTTMSIWRNAQDSCAVVLYTVQGGGHTWPGGRQYLPKKIVGKTSRDFNATAVMWEFFKQHNGVMTKRK
jgi:polyhydroxybutyrate depolymerase